MTKIMGNGACKNKLPNTLIQKIAGTYDRHSQMFLINYG